MKKCLILAAFLLGGCADVDRPKIEPLRLSDGSMGVMINCGGRDSSMGDCMKVAGAACPTGYTVVDQSSQTTPVHVEGVGSTVHVNRTMIVKCSAAH